MSRRSTIPSVINVTESQGQEANDVTRLLAHIDKAERQFQEAKELIKLQKPLFIIGSPPCTTFSSLQNMNRGTPRGAAKVAQYIREFKRIWKAFIRVAEAVVAKRGYIAIEWPQRCQYWTRHEVQEAMKQSLKNFNINRIPQAHWFLFFVKI